MSKKKSTPTQESPNLEEPKVETPTQSGEDASKLESEVAAPELEESATLTLDDIQRELNILKEIVSEHTKQIIYLQNTVSRKRRSTSNSKIQILDKATGEIYSSKNQAYQTLLKAGELKELVDKGVFGPEPEKNTFGWYALVRAWPDRFEEIKAEAVTK